MNKLVFITLIFFAWLFLHNAWFYHPLGGYDQILHTKYAKILIFEKRLPTPADTAEAYNPPLFYFLSGKLAQLTSPWFNQDFLEALKSWQILMALLLPFSGWFWLDIFRQLNPKNNGEALFFLTWLLSIPVIGKMAPMFNLETPQLILGSFTIWLFIKSTLKKPTLFKIIVLGLLVGLMLWLRIMSFSLLAALGLTMIIKRQWRSTAVFIIIALLTGGWYYLFHFNQAVINDTPLVKTQPRSFYTDLSPRLFWSRPIRPYFPNRFIPIFYSDFWGDYWNYFPQRRFGLTTFDLRQSRLFFTEQKINRLAWQNRINVIPSLVLILGMLTTITQMVKTVKNKKITYYQSGELFLTFFFLATFLAFYYVNLKYADPLEGDSIKSSYILFAIPVVVYFGTKFLAGLKRYPPIFYPALAIISGSILVNLNFLYF